MNQPLEVGSLMEHPKFQAMIGEIRQEKLERENNARNAQLEVARIRQEQLVGMKHSLRALIDQYEHARADLHSLLGQIHSTERQLSNFTGQASGILPTDSFRKIHLPRLAPYPAQAGPYASPLDVGIATTQDAMNSVQAGNGWPTFAFPPVEGRSVWGDAK